MILSSFARRRVISYAAVVALSASAGAVAATLFFASPADRVAPRDLASPAPSAGSDDYAQTYSPYCQTAQGVCTLASAQPIGSACQCDGEPGRIIP